MVMPVKKRFPISILKRLKKLPRGFSGLNLCDPYRKKEKVFSNWNFFDMKVVNKKYNLEEKDGKLILKHNPPVLTLFPNFYGLASVIGQRGEMSSKVPILEETTGNKKVLYFFDEYVRRDINTRLLLEENFYFYVGIVDKNLSILYSRDRLDSRKKYWLKALEIPFIFSESGDKVLINRYLIFSYKEYKENFDDVKRMRFKNIHDLSLLWDFERNSNVFDVVEEFIVLSNIFYCEGYTPSLNLILCGVPRVKKTGILQVCERIFGDKVTGSQSSTTKGLTPSFWSDQPKLGALLSSRFIFLGDDFFRLFSQQTQKYKSKLMAIYTGLEALMPLLDRGVIRYSSGKKDVNNVQFLASFFASDNNLYKNELPKIYKRDPALVRRYTFLLISKGTEERGLAIRTLSIKDVYRNFIKRWKKMKTFRGFGHYGKFGRFVRKEMKKQKIDKTRIDRITRILEKKYGNVYNLQIHFHALYKCFRFFKKIIRNFPNDVYERACERIVVNAHELFSGKKGDEWKETVDDRDFT